MIAFVCKECGKRFERPPEQAGSLVFCACGMANRVPWESAALPPATAEPIPEAIPLAHPIPPSRPSDDRSASWESRQPARQPRDPAFCFNHPDASSTGVCSACGERFCPNCLITLQNEKFCGPCKNFRLRTLEMPAHLSTLAIVAPVVALVGSFFTLFLLLMGAGLYSSSGGGALFLWIVGLLPQGVAVVLAFMAIRKVENDPRTGGGALAMTGVVMALIAVIVAIEIAVLILRTSQ